MKFTNPVILLLLILVFKSSLSQSNMVAFDANITSSSQFDSPKALSESFLKLFLSNNSEKWSNFYNLKIFCALIDEEISDSIPENKIKKEELCKEEVLYEIFANTISYKRRVFLVRKGISIFQT